MTLVIIRHHRDRKRTISLSPITCIELCCILYLNVSSLQTLPTFYILGLLLTQRAVVSLFSLTRFHSCMWYIMQFEMSFSRLIMSGNPAVIGS